MGDFSARVGNHPVAGRIGPEGEPVTNNNGILLKDFCTFNSLKISNTLFRHKNIHKYTWEARGTKSIIDYIIINNKLNDNIKHTRVFRGSEIDSDHMLAESRLEFTTRNTYNKWKKEKESIINKHFKIHLLEQESIRNLYKNRGQPCSRMFGTGLSVGRLLGSLLLGPLATGCNRV
jgi:hypothetical protein